jgi:membrane protease YdiL (CAAX protease family)
MISTRRAIGGAVGVLVATAIARGLAMGAVAAALGADLASSDPAARRDGMLVAAGILGGTLVGGLALAWVAWPAPRAALALDRPALRDLVGWTLAAAALVALFEVASRLAGRPTLEPGWLEVYRTAPIALLAAALIATSIFEELYFRGLLQGALARTRLGATGAVALTALLFTATHAPGDLWRFADVFAGALLLGIGRARTGSSLTLMAAHVFGNLKVLAVLALAD